MRRGRLGDTAASTPSWLFLIGLLAVIGTELLHVRDLDRAFRQDRIERDRASMRIDERIDAMESGISMSLGILETRIGSSRETCRFWMERSSPIDLRDKVAVHCDARPCEVIWAMDEAWPAPSPQVRTWRP